MNHEELSRVRRRAVILNLLGITYTKHEQLRFWQLFWEALGL